LWDAWYQCHAASRTPNPNSQANWNGRGRCDFPMLWPAKVLSHPTDNQFIANWNFASLRALQSPNQQNSTDSCVQPFTTTFSVSKSSICSPRETDSNGHLYFWLHLISQRNTCITWPHMSANFSLWLQPLFTRLRLFVTMFKLDHWIWTTFTEKILTKPCENFLSNA